MRKNKWIDISVPLRSGMAYWPGDPPCTIRRFRSIDKGDKVNISQISMGSHTATHIDAPYHFLRKGTTADNIPLGCLIGPCRVIKIKDTESIKAKELKKYHIRKGERILFKTVNSPRAWQSKEFCKDFVYISEEAAGYLAKTGVSVVGIDYLSVGSYYKGGALTHRTLLTNGVCIIEGLNLYLVKSGRYLLVCLPIKIDCSDAAPCRAVLRQYG